MTAHMYMKFMITLAFGLAGLGLVMKVLLDRVFNDGELVGEVGDFVRGLTRRSTTVRIDRAEDILMDRESKPRELTTRLLDQRREQLKALDEVEAALSRPRVLTAEEEFLSQN